MSETLFKGRYRNGSNRKPFWDYRNSGAYFITICTKDRTHYFGEIIDGQIILSPLGAIANVLWHEIQHHTKNCYLGEYIVMPDHIHGILILENNYQKNDDPVAFCRHVACNVPTECNVPTGNKNEFMSAISPEKNSISTIVRSYKSAVTKHANRLGFDFQWQSRFYDHIIRNNESFERITTYILNNPKEWQQKRSIVQQT
ncbi:MAG: transposase [Bacteroidota bacterium]|jgi:REP element-mobilizing transposase RayT